MAPQKSLKEAAESNRSLLGDPVSLKAEKSDTEPTEHDRGAAGEKVAEPPNDKPTGTSMQRKSLKQMAKENPTQLGDPVSLKAETSDTEPTPNDRGAASDVPAEEAPAEKPVKSKI